MNWSERFLDLASHIAEWSKDPSTKCGAVIARGNRIVSLGFNGFPSGVHDYEDRLEDRDMKYKMVLHAEVNALLFAKGDLSDCTLYVVPMPPCSRCAAQIIQAGIKTIVTVPPPADKLERWRDDFLVASLMYREANVELLYLADE